MTRKPGYYWVRLNLSKEWEIGNYDGESEWFLTESSDPFFDRDFSEIGPQAVTPKNAESMADLLQAAKNLHSDVVSLVECIEECEQDGGRSYDTTKTRRLLADAHYAIQKAENHEPTMPRVLL